MMISSVKCVMSCLVEWSKLMKVHRICQNYSQCIDELSAENVTTTQLIRTIRNVDIDVYYF